MQLPRSPHASVLAHHHTEQREQATALFGRLSLLRALELRNVRLPHMGALASLVSLEQVALMVAFTECYDTR